MAKIHGVAGEWARVKGTVIGLWPLFLGIFSTGFSLAFVLVSPVVGLAGFAVSAAGCALALMRGLRHVERYFKGARGEERVAGILKSLPETFHVFNDFEACGKHVDHVVAGPAGVFAVETKFWREKVTIEDGHILVGGRLPNRSPLAQVLKEAASVKAQLAKLGWTGSVTPVLAFASDTFEAKIAELQGAVVINSNHLRESFGGGRSDLTPLELDRLIGLMESNT